MNRQKSRLSHFEAVLVIPPKKFPHTRNLKQRFKGRDESDKADPKCNDAVRPEDGIGGALQCPLRGCVFK